MKIGLLIRELRKEKKWTQEELALKMGGVKSLICNFENGTAFPTEERIKQLEEIFGVANGYFNVQEQSKVNRESYDSELIEELRSTMDFLKKQNEQLTNMLELAIKGGNFPEGDKKEAPVVKLNTGFITPELVA